MTLFGYGMLIISVKLQVISQNMLILGNIRVIFSAYRQRKVVRKVSKFHEELPPDGFSVKLKKDKKCTTTISGQ